MSCLPSWSHLIPIDLCYVLGLCHSFKGCACPLPSCFRRVGAKDRNIFLKHTGTHYVSHFGPYGTRSGTQGASIPLCNHHPYNLGPYPSNKRIQGAKLDLNSNPIGSIWLGCHQESVPTRNQPGQPLVVSRGKKDMSCPQ